MESPETYPAVQAQEFGVASHQYGIEGLGEGHSKGIGVRDGMVHFPSGGSENRVVIGCVNGNG
jgi:hypothetical protein